MLAAALWIGHRVSVIVAQLGARRHYAVPRGLYAAGLLERLMTDACAANLPWRWLDELMPTQTRPGRLRRLLDRRVEEVPASLIRGFPLLTLSTVWWSGSDEAQTDYWAERNAAFGKKVVKAGFGQADAVYGFNGAALEIFRAAQERGLTAILDQTAAPWRSITALLRKEQEQWPAWETVAAEIDQSGRLSAREEEEWAIADRIICGSEFVVSALAACGGPKDRCTTVPYPAFLVARIGELGKFDRSYVGRPLRVLFAGTLQLRKGVQYLLEAKRQLKTAQVEFRLVGSSRLSERAISELSRHMEVVGPAPRSEMARHYTWADVLVLPTLSEGSANVCYEAMAAGLPVITTPNAGSVVRDGIEGFVVPVRDAEAITDRLDRLASDLNHLEEMSSAALLRAPNFTLERYKDRLVATLEPIIGTATG